MTSYRAQDFKFGLETEYIVFCKNSAQPLWHDTVTFERLNGIFESIPLDGIPSLNGLELEKPHRLLMPYVVEGYHLPDQDFQAKSLLPKGVEIRTPVCRTIDECIMVQRTLLSRLVSRLDKDGLGLVALSHHPKAHHFTGPQNKRRHDFWQWAMEVMTTYGPDINVGVTPELWAEIDEADLLAKINYYGPSLSALSVRSPFRDGGLWKIRGKVGKSLRMYRRSIVAPPIEFHKDEDYRLEFKVFDMPATLEEFRGYFLLFLALLLDKELRGRASNSTRTYDLGDVAVNGLLAEGVAERLSELFDSVERVLPAMGFETKAMEIFHDRIATRRTPADHLVERYEQMNGNLPRLLTELCAQTAEN